MKNIKIVSWVLAAVLVMSFGIIAVGCGTTEKPKAPTFNLSSSKFENNGSIPDIYANTGKGITGATNASIPLSWSNPPSGTQSFALSMIDKSASDFVHWLVVNIPSTVSSLEAGASGSSMPAGSTELTNGSGLIGYEGPWPPQPDPAHNYLITVYALNGTVDAGSITNLATFNTAVLAKRINSASITGTFDW
jgi:Raf kinase inhibitor-like YbhB/YbcL family protein